MDFLINCLVWVISALALGQIIHLIAATCRTSKLPPGPFPLPIVGNLFHLGNRPHRTLAKFADIYGPIISLKLGCATTIVISSADMAREILQKQDHIFCNRAVIDAVKACQHDEVSVIWLPVATQWRNLRKICNSYIVNNQKLDANQELRGKKIQQLIASVQESCHNGQSIDIGQAAFKTTFNSLSNTILSLDLADSSSDMAREFKELIRCTVEEAGKPNLSDYFPLLRKIDLQGIRRRMEVHFRKIFVLFDRMINERLESRKLEGYVPTNDMLDNLLNLSQETTGQIDRRHIKDLFLDLFGAGTDTTTSTLEWAMAELLHNPNTLSRARAELEQTIGKGNAIEESDIVRLPYLQAIVKETLRLHPAAPLLVPRTTEADIEFCGYIIPKNAKVVVNAWAIGRDPTTWENPNAFVPERFLGSEIDVRGHSFELIPFGSGRRICPGLPFALRMIHLMLAALINSFDWKLEAGMKPGDMDMEEENGFTLRKAQPVRAIPVPVA